MYSILSNFLNQICHVTVRTASLCITWSDTLHITEWFEPFFGILDSKWFQNLFLVIKNLKFSIHLPLFLLTRSPDDSPVILSRDPMKLPMFPKYIESINFFGINFIFFRSIFFIFERWWLGSPLKFVVWGVARRKQFWIFEVSHYLAITLRAPILIR